MTENLTPWTDPELEARVVALVLGEASDFERDQLSQILAANPDLAAFQRQIETVHSLLRETSGKTGVGTGGLADWQLPDTRRQPLVDALATAAPAPRAAKRRRQFPFHPAIWVAAAACLVLLGVALLRRPADHFAAVNTPASSAAAPLPSTAQPESRASSDRGNFAANDQTAGTRSDSDRPQETQFRRALRRPAATASPIQVTDADDSAAQAPTTGRLAIASSAGRKSDPAAAPMAASGIAFERPAKSDAGIVALQAVPSSPPPLEGQLEQRPAPEPMRLAKELETPVPALGNSVSQARQPDAEGGQASAGPAADLRAIPETRFKMAESGGFEQRQIESKARSIAETSAADEPFSTFSLHVSDTSFKLAQAALEQGKWPAPEQVRIEEFVNAFDYEDPSPAAPEAIACTLEQAIHPFQQGRNLLRISLRTSSAGRSASTPLQLTLLLDTTGSLERSGRRETLQAALAQLSGLLQPGDRVSLISFARQPRLLADQLPGDQSRDLTQIVSQTPSDGGANLDAALRLAAEKARQHFLPGAQNRIVLLTGDAANLSHANPSRWAPFVEAMRREGIAFDTAGIGADGLSDSILETLSREGDGRYYPLNRPEDANANFAAQLAGAFRQAAQDTQVQVWFNPDRVRRYRLLGSDEHRLPTKPFQDGQTSLPEPAEAGVALYQFEPLASGKGDAGYVSVRFQEGDTRRVIERRWPIPYEPKPLPFEQAPAGIQLAASAAFLAAKLGDDPLAPGVDLAILDRAAANSELRAMIQQTRNLAPAR